MPQQTSSDGGRNDDHLSLDQVLELLGQYQRREILRQLRNEPDREHSIDELVAYLVSIERKRNAKVPGEDHLLSVIVHIHGPKLQEAGLIDYNARDMDVRYYPDERVEAFLDRIDEWDEKF